jgi:hypothetical protein
MIVLITVFVNQEEPQNEDRIGVVYDLKRTQSGFTFMFDESDGEKVKCFSRTEPSELSVYVVRGSLSEDGSIFFVSSMQKVPQNELYHN